MTENVEEFKCPNCNASNYICWSEGEASRTIPCLTCYGEEWSVVEVDAGPPVVTETVMSTRGAKFVCSKGFGVRAFTRDSFTLLEIK